MKQRLACLAAALIVLLHARFAEADPLKVYVLCGQSNMQGHAQVSTLAHLAMDPATESMLTEIRDADGNDRVFDDIWISSLGSAAAIRQGKLTTGYGAAGRGQVKIGPELTFGIYMQKHVNQPILIIKTAWGGKSLHTDFRPPSAGPYQFSDREIERIRDQGKDIDAVRDAREQATGAYYRQMVAHVKDVLADVRQVIPQYKEADGFELAGFVWFQGWNDMVARDVYPNRDQPGGYDSYTRLLKHLIRDVRRDLNAPALPFVIGVMGTGGPVKDYAASRQRYAATHRNFREAMAAPASLPEFQGNVTAVLTEESWDGQLTELVDRRNQVRDLERRLKKDVTLSAAARQQAVSDLQEELFTEEELQTLAVGVSNAEYHYLGSAKILARIGKSFADALAQISH